MTQEVILVPRPRAAPFDLKMRACLHVLRLAPFFIAAEERGHRHGKGVGQHLQRGQAGRGVAVFNLGQHPDRQTGHRRQIRHRHALLAAKVPHLAANRGLQIALGDLAHAVRVLVKRRFCARQGGRIVQVVHRGASFTLWLKSYG